MAEDSTFDPDLKTITKFHPYGYDIRTNKLIPNKKHLQYKLRKVGELLTFI